MPYTLVQLTDCHLGSGQDATLLGVNTQQTFDDVLQDVYEKVKHVDLFVLSGDISNEHDDYAYHYIMSQLPAETPQVWLPGNHDDNKIMAAAVGKNFLNQVKLGSWVISAQDSSIKHEVAGYIESTALSSFENTLLDAPNDYHILFIHHHLLPIQSQWIDALKVSNGEAVLAKLKAYQQLKLIGCGHVHQDSVMVYDHIQLVSAPSTCFQFKPKQQQFMLDSALPGYRIFHLHDDGQVDSTVFRVKPSSWSLDIKASGY